MSDIHQQAGSAGKTPSTISLDVPPKVDDPITDPTIASKTMDPPPIVDDLKHNEPTPDKVPRKVDDPTTDPTIASKTMIPPPIVDAPETGVTVSKDNFQQLAHTVEWGGVHAASIAEQREIA